jgi:polar amino acid transport system substrate-binding protein
VDSAIDYAKANGKEKALKEFNDNKSALFIKNGLYVFAYDFNGTMIGMPYQLDLVGKNRIDYQDPNGVKFVRTAIGLVKNGGGFIYYVYPDPATNMTQRLKLTYVSKVDDTWWIGAGYYPSDLTANFSQTSRNDLVNYVEDAVKYAKEKGKDSAIREFNNNKSAQFIKDDLYVFAYDFNGTMLAIPYQPRLLGNNRMDIQDPNGVKFVRPAIDLVNAGGGFIYYIYPDPARNMTLRLKLTYVSKVDDTWWLGAGIYAQ